MKITLLVIIILLSLFNPDFVFAGSSVLNELMPHPSPGNDWIEIYNPTTNTIDLTNWTIVDSTSIMKTLSGSITANGFVTFDVTNRLNNSGDSVYLKDSSGATIDNYSYSSDPGLNKSIGRSPDGGSWTILVSSSKGSSNGGSTPTLTPSPTPSPTPSSSPTNNASSSSSFIISNIPSQINSDQVFNTTITLSLPDNPNTAFYLKGAFKKSDSSNYFGLTKISGNWVKNNSNYSNQYAITTNVQGYWSGNLEIQPDSEDSGFTGSGDYVFKVGRYTSSGSGPTWSNEATINIISTAQIAEQSSNTKSGNSTYNTNTSSSPPTNSSKSILSKAPYLKTSYQIASIAGATASATPTAQVSVKSQKQTNPIVWVGLIFMLAGVGLIGYVYLRKR